MFLSSKKINSSEDFSVHLRGLSLQMVNAANSSHIGGVLSMADVISVLYHSVLNIDKSNYEHPDRDRFILSKDFITSTLSLSVLASKIACFSLF